VSKEKNNMNNLLPIKDVSKEMFRKYTKTEIGRFSNISS
jgi:hypothetical protein